MITLYCLVDSRAERIVWCLNFLKLEYVLELFPRDKRTKLAPAELKKIHPSGKSPILKDGDLLLAESGVIIDYLITTYGQDSELAPKSTAEKWHIQTGMVAAESNIMITMMQIYINSIARSKLPWGLSFLIGKALDTIEDGYARPELDNCLTNLQSTIEANGGYYSSGHLSGADIMYYFSGMMLRKSSLFGDFDAKYPGLATWCDRMDKRIKEADDPKLKVKTIDHSVAQTNL